MFDQPHTRKPKGDWRYMMYTQKARNLPPILKCNNWKKDASLNANTADKSHP